MSQYVENPRFFIYENNEVIEVSETSYYQWSSRNWHPGHLKHSSVSSSKDEVFLGFLGHYKFCEWRGKPFNVTYFVYGNDIQWQAAYDEYYDTYEEAEARFNILSIQGYDVESNEILQAA